MTEWGERLLATENFVISALAAGTSLVLNMARLPKRSAAMTEWGERVLATEKFVIPALAAGISLVLNTAGVPRRGAAMTGWGGVVSRCRNHP